MLAECLRINRLSLIRKTHSVWTRKRVELREIVAALRMITRRIKLPSVSLITLKLEQVH